MEDDKDLQTFVELRNKLNDAAQRNKLFVQQTNSTKIKLQRATFTAAELDPLPEDCTLYREIGKAYLRLSKETVMDQLEETVKGSQEELEQLKLKREHAEKQQKEGEAELRELLKTNTALAQKLAAMGR